LTEHDGGDDGADAGELGQAGPRCCDRGSDAALQVLEVAVEAPDVTEEVLGQALAFDLDRARGPHATKQHRGPVGLQPQRSATRDQLPHKHMQPADRLGAQRSEVTVTV
jgi:hypothetical protein